MGKNIARLYSAELEGIDAKIIEVEADINVGLHFFGIVGLADRALNEAKERVNSALKNSGVKPPNRENRKITINLAPADVRKTGTHYDLAIALAYLLATKQIRNFDGADKIFLGELALDGRLRAIRGALSIAQRAGELGFKYLFLPKDNANEAAPIAQIKIIPVENFREVIDMLEGRKNMKEHIFEPGASKQNQSPDFSEIKGQGNAKRALTIAAAGMHNILFIGAPGVGKSFLASALAGILPELAVPEAIDVTKIWSAAGQSPNGLMQSRPFRAPHHTISPMALIGGGADPKPGEISLAHRGVLFLDELPEFDRAALEALRQPIESGMVHVSRAKKSLIFPARFTLVAAMNPCPCGYYGNETHECQCGAYEIIRYQRKVSGPLLDRIDIRIKVGAITVEELRKGSEVKRPSESHDAQEKIRAAKSFQEKRLIAMGIGAKANAELTAREVQMMIGADSEAERFLRSIDKSNLSPRGYYRLLKVARTIADLGQKENVSAECLAEAFSYRVKEEF